MSLPADELRAAAARIRETFKGLPDGPWRPSISTPRHAVRYGSGWSLASADYEDSGPQAMKHMALWDPIVAEAIAAWLVDTADSMSDENAREVTYPDRAFHQTEVEGATEGHSNREAEWTSALAAARAINASKEN